MRGRALFADPSLAGLRWLSAARPTGSHVPGRFLDTTSATGILIYGALFLPIKKPDELVIKSSTNRRRVPLLVCD